MANYKLSYTAAQFEQAMNAYNNNFKDVSQVSASAADVLAGTYIVTNEGRVAGAMTNNGNVTGSISTKDGSYTIPTGYHSGAGTVKISDTEKAKIIPANIKKGVTIFGVTGTYTGSSSGSSSGSGLPNTIIAGDTPVIANWAGINITSTTMTDTKISITIKKAGTYRFKIPAVAKSSFSSGSPTVSLYKNGTSANSTTITSSTVECVSFDLECAVGDVISVYAKAVGSNYSSTTVTVFGLIACIDWANGL